MRRQKAGKGDICEKCSDDHCQCNHGISDTREERENVSKEQYRVRFYQNREGMLGEGSCYKVYTVEEGQCLQPPAEPGGNGVVFAGWHDWNDYAADFSQPIEENRDYYAAWE